MRKKIKIDLEKGGWMNKQIYIQIQMRRKIKIYLEIDEWIDKYFYRDRWSDILYVHCTYINFHR